ncbi:MAG TPA: DUF4175 family protein [Acidobacteriota bacterium]
MRTEVGKEKSIDTFVEGIRLALQKRRAEKVALLSVGLLSLLLLLEIWFLYWMDFRAALVSPLRLLLVCAALAAALIAWFFWRRRIESLRVARYVEEKNPHLEQRLITAVERSHHPGNPFWPLLEKDVIRSTSSVRMESDFEAQRPWVIGALAAIGLTCAIFLLGPSFFRYGLGKLLAFSSAAKPLYEISVVPGNARIAPGMDQEIEAKPSGFEPDQIVLFYKFRNQPHWESISMERAASTREKAREGISFSHLLMDIREPLQYYVESQRIRSPQYRIDVADWPRVEKISLQYFYPAYTGLKTRKVDDGGDIQAIRGTRVRIDVQFNEKPQRPQLYLEGKRQAIELSGQDGKRYSGELTVDEDDQYWVRISSPEGDVRSSKAYEIVAVDDRPPLVRFTRPGRDQKVSRLEEVPTELEAEDDFGLRNVQLNYSVNGAKEKSITLFGSGVARQVKKDYTFSLEEMNVQPGDFISYYGVARDAVSTSKTDIYFLEVKPFEREYYQNQSGDGQSGAGQQDDRMLSRRQKEIIAGTWKVLQDDKKKSHDEKTENLKTLALVQHRLQQQAESILERLMRRQGSFTDTTGRQMIENLQQAARLMEPAHQDLSREQAAAALTYEQQALQKLLRAEALMKEVQVSWGMGSQGGGGDSRAEELADLFELERDQMKNQYETLQQSQPGQQRDPKTDEALQKLKELARRQQQNLQQGSSAAEQRRLQQETEELARQLERLSRQRQNPQMGEIARQLNEASRNMQSGMQGQGNPSSGGRALDQLRQAQSQLSQMQQQQGEREFSQLNQTAENLVRHQEEIEARVSSMQQRGGSSAREVMRALDDKESLRRQLRNLEQELDETARRNAAGQRKASQDLKSAANEIRDRRMEDKVQQGGSLLYRGLLEQARQREQALTQEFRDLQNRIAEAQQSMQASRSAANGGANDDASRLQRAMQDTGRLLDQLEQMRRGQQPGAEQTSAGQRGKGQPQNGQNSSSGQPGNNSQQGNSQNGQRDSSSGRQQAGNNQQGNSGRGSESAGRQQAGNSSQEGSQNRGSSASSSRGEGGITDSAGPFSGGNNRGIRPDAPVNPMSESELRQFWSDRLKDAQDIQRSLSGSDRELARQAADLLERMRQLDKQRSLQDPQEVARLQSSIIQGFRALELKMGLRLQERKANLQLFNQEDVPLEYRKAVEEYYKSLARSKANTGK